MCFIKFLDLTTAFLTLIQIFLYCMRIYSHNNVWSIVLFYEPISIFNMEL